MTEEQIYAELTKIFHEAFGDETLVIRSDTTAADIPGWDSIKMVAIILSVESHFSLRLRAREIDQLKCVGDFVRLIHGKLSA